MKIYRISIEKTQSEIDASSRAVRTVHNKRFRLIDLVRHGNAFSTRCDFSSRSQQLKGDCLFIKMFSGYQESVLTRCATSLLTNGNLSSR